MEHEIIFRTNSEQVINELNAMRKVADETGLSIVSNNEKSGDSFSCLIGMISMTKTAYTGMSNAISAVTQVAEIYNKRMEDSFAGLERNTYGINNNVLAMTTSIEVLTTQTEVITTSIGAINSSFYALRTNTQAVRENIEAIEGNIGELDALTIIVKNNTGTINNNTSALRENEKENWFLVTVRSVLATIQATVNALTLVNTILTFKKNMADKLDIALTKKKTLANVVATKKGIAKAAAQFAALVTTPFVGIALGVAAIAAIAAGIIGIRSAIPKCATGAVISAPTMALVGEGRYPEAVVPLGSSPQFASMKEDIANAVLGGMSAMGGVARGGNNRPLTIELNIDGKQFAEATVSDIVDTLNNEGYSVLRADAVYR